MLCKADLGSQSRRARVQSLQSLHSGRVKSRHKPHFMTFCFPRHTPRATWGNVRDSLLGSKCCHIEQHLDLSEHTHLIMSLSLFLPTPFLSEEERAG